MKRCMWFILGISLISSSFPAFGDIITLNSPEALSTPSAAKMEWVKIEIFNQEKLLRVHYKWKNSEGLDIHLNENRSDTFIWTCQDIEVFGTNAECVGPGNPYKCCTDIGAGSCDDVISTCFSDTFGFAIRSQDVGTKIGVGLRTMIWNKMKANLLSPGNDGSFD